MKKAGLIINPIAGMGGKVGLKGTDGPETVEKARALGARPEANDRAALALRLLLEIKDKIELITCPGDMGEAAARQCGFQPQVLDIGLKACSSQEDETKSPFSVSGENRNSSRSGQTDHPPGSQVQPGAAGDRAGGGNFFTRPATGPADTEAAAKAMAEMAVDLLLFAGGDGTARNLYNALGDDPGLAVIGIPAGVKIHSAVYATSPQNAGELARQFLQEGSLPLRRAEVMDIDEEAFRQGRLSARLYGYLPVPCSGALMQHLKIGAVETEESVLEAIADHVVEKMEAGVIYIIGPGSTTVPIMKKLGLESTLLGVDVVCNGKLLAADANEKRLLELIDGKKAVIVVTVIGGQGYIFGRGNQQISADVIRAAGKDNIVVVAARDKILSLENSRLLVDTGDDQVNRMLGGYITVVTGYREEMICPLSS